MVLQPAYTLSDVEAHHTHHTKYSFLKGVNGQHNLAREGTETLDWAKGWTQEGSPVWETPRTDEIPEMMLSRSGNSSCRVCLRAITRRVSPLCKCPKLRKPHVKGVQEARDIQYQ